jgi:hypothetical protein
MTKRTSVLMAFCLLLAANSFSETNQDPNAPVKYDRGQVFNFALLF